MSTPTWLAAVLAIGSLLAFVYFTADLAVLIRGPESVPSAIARLARAGDRRVARRSLPTIIVTAGAAAVFVATPALWLLLRHSEMDLIGQLLLALGLIAATVWAVTLWVLVRRMDATPR